GTLSVTSTGAITQSGALTQAAGGAMLTLNAGTSVSLNKAGNDFTGKVNVAQASGVTLTNRGALDLTPSTALSGDVTLRSGSKIDLSGLDLSTNLTSLAVHARQTTVTTNVTAATGDISFDGKAMLGGPTPLTLLTQGGGNIHFVGDVKPTVD